MKSIALATLLLLGMTESDGCAQYDMTQVREEAQRWLGEMRYDFYGFSCSDTDSDHDGYVSCTVNLKEHAEPLLIECRAYSGHGCRAALPKVIMQGRR